MKLVNRDNGEVLLSKIRFANHFFTRFIGLLFTRSLHPDHGLHLVPCRSVHTFFMNYSIDILHLNEEHSIVGMEEQVKPGKIGKTFPGTTSIVELLAGRLAQSHTEVGHTLSFERESSE